MRLDRPLPMAQGLHGDDLEFTVVLSRRNLLALLAKLDGHPCDSMCTIESPPGDGIVFRVKAEDDDEHYNHPDRGELLKGYAGPMHPETERLLPRTKKRV